MGFAYMDQFDFEDDFDDPDFCDNCGEKAIDQCQECGVPLCMACSEGGVGFCRTCPTKNFDPYPDIPTLGYKFCPICGTLVSESYIIESSAVFQAYDPYVGLMVWGPAGVYKEVVCQHLDLVHFKFEDGEHRLARMISAEPVVTTRLEIFKSEKQDSAISEDEIPF